MNYLFPFALFFLSTLLLHVQSLDAPLVSRMIRAAVSSKKPECRYDKNAWEECDSNGIQKRIMKLRPGQSNECENEKVLTRPCKKACRYAKGTWTECQNGVKTRKDSLRAQAPGCDNERTISRKCKSVCRYSRSEWGPCESSVKTKVLTLVEGNPNECEGTRKITKQCPSATTGRPNLNKQGSGSGGSSNDKTQRNLKPNKSS